MLTQPCCCDDRPLLFRYSIHYALSDPAQNHKINQADWLDARAPTLPRLLKTVGYHTAHIGKWHLGDGEPHLIGAPTMADYGIDESLVYHGPGPQLNQRQIGLEAVRAIERMKGQQPFYLNVWLHEMHTKHFPTQESMDAFKHLDPRRQVYAATLRDGDNNVGMVLEALKGKAWRTTPSSCSPATMARQAPLTQPTTAHLRPRMAT